MFPNLIEEVLDLNLGTLVITENEENNPAYLGERKIN